MPRRLRVTCSIAAVTLLAVLPDLQAQAPSKGASSGKLVVKVAGLRSDNGKVRAGLFTSDKKFPLGVDSLGGLIEAPIEGAEAILTFPDLPHGEYAVVVYHDEDESRSLAKNWLGKPKEGMGVFKPPASRFPPPSFDDCKFGFTSSQMTVDVSMNYL